MPDISKDHLYRAYGDALDRHNAALFVGAGISRGAGYPTWKEFLKEVAEALDLDIDKESDLLSLAQYHENANDRQPLNDLLIRAFGVEKPLTENHRLMAQLPIETVWTTNYDTLMERAYRNNNKQSDVKSVQDDLSTSMWGRDVTIYKMHGDIAHPAEIVLTKNDYEMFGRAREHFATVLKGDLVNKTFLFLGYSLEDPNIDHILARIRILFDTNKRPHYCVMRWPDRSEAKYAADPEAYGYDLRRLKHRIDDLHRYNIQVVKIDSFAEITEILERLNRIAHRRNVFLSGAAKVPGPLGADGLRNFSYGLGKRLIEAGFNFVSGLGQGVGSDALMGAMEAVYADPNRNARERIAIRPFPQIAPTDPRRAELYTRNREDIVTAVGSLVFLAGNRNSPSGGIEDSSGMYEEYEIGKSKGRLLIPIGASGFQAEKIWNEMMADVASLPKGTEVHYRKLGDVTASIDSLLDSVIAILKQVTEVRP